MCVNFGKCNQNKYTESPNCLFVLMGVFTESVAFCCFLCKKQLINHLAKFRRSHHFFCVSRKRSAYYDKNNFLLRVGCTCTFVARITPLSMLMRMCVICKYFSQSRFQGTFTSTADKIPNPKKILICYTKCFRVIVGFLIPKIDMAYIYLWDLGILSGLM